MKKPDAPEISARKTPRQARSARMVRDILEAAVRVLTRDGPRRFTTVRVAEEAGVSVGSLYQYFPNKEALLFRLQTDEWNETGGLLEDILRDARLPPAERLRRAVVTFFRSEREEAELRVALDVAGVLFRDAQEARANWRVWTRRMRAFMEEALPRVPAAERAVAADFVMTSMSAVAEKITAQRRPRAEVDAWARASAEMYWGYRAAVAARAGKALPPAGTP
jgi:AcrR family transcriptional regulator